MGDIANAMINGDIDEQTGEWLGEGGGFPRTMERGFYNSIKLPRNSKKYSKSTEAIRRELAILIKTTKKDNPKKNENLIVNECRQAINIKYGKGWREQI